MPIYEFQCLKCGYKFDKLYLQMTDKTEIECPKCQGKAKKIPSAIGHFEFKGALA